MNDAAMIIALLVIPIAVFALTRWWDGRSNPAQNPQLTSEPNEPPPRSRENPLSTGLEDLPSFDSQTATETIGKETLRGSAYVVDGDTIVLCNTQIRLFGIDAPELEHPYGKKAKWALHSLCKGKEVIAEITARDAHGRTVAKCSLKDGRDLSAEMVKIGLAIDWAKFSGGVYRHIEPQDARRKLWLADARQKGRMQVWEAFEAKQSARNSGSDA